MRTYIKNDFIANTIFAMVIVLVKLMVGDTKYIGKGKYDGYYISLLGAYTIVIITNIVLFLNYENSVSKTMACLNYENSVSKIMAWISINLFYTMIIFTIRHVLNTEIEYDEYNDQ